MGVVQGLDPNGEGYNQLKLFDDNGDLLWKDDASIAPVNDCIGDSIEPAIFDDIDLDGNIELIIWTSTQEAYSPGCDIYRWNGKKFTRTKHQIDLVWTDAPNGNTLQWPQIDFKDYDKRKKIWWSSGLSQMANNELPVVEIVGVQYPDFNVFQRLSAKIRFTPTGAIIEKLIK